MERTTIMLPADLRSRAMERARQSGMSLAEYIRSLLNASLAGEGHSASAGDLFWSDAERYRGESAGDLSARHDDYLYPRAARRMAGRKPKRRRRR